MPLVLPYPLRRVNAKSETIRRRIYTKKNLYRRPRPRHYEMSLNGPRTMSSDIIELLYSYRLYALGFTLSVTLRECKERNKFVG